MFMLRYSINVCHFVNNVKAVGIHKLSVYRLLYKFRYIKIHSVPPGTHIGALRFLTKEQACVNFNMITFEPEGLFITDDLTGIPRITALLHEFGHVQDLSYKPKRWRIYRNKLEKRAWKHAILLAKEFKFKMDATMAVQWLGTYGQKYKRLENLVGES